MRRILEKIIGRNHEVKTTTPTPLHPTSISPSPPSEDIFIHFTYCPECHFLLHPPTYEVCRRCGWVMLD